ncbi:protein-L-isoaspartate O-methyltransferase [Fulvimarina pelagi HTCC2506]|uniref:Protein-L-isoaspartate O-methyltransferase n=2 Tax=Fulvimarina pelagi TaxID=217511 RepID=Q0FZN8_9HYPH|nr:rRNA adenine N-6-methyltransferase family protein [Fulvimarina pelagi]EAU40553.1 protein-L-isoaspartate O-methyltransferase [Fulvimarina pelagi HTCC2506]BAT31576.1 protein-L-isoaspartate O-methyltransferase [Fulvimarina pelagi]
MSAEAGGREQFLADLAASNPTITQAVLTAAAEISREAFLPVSGARPYAPGPVPINCGETMPDAATAIRLVDALDLSPEHRVLEIGTGSGFVTALIAKLALHVTSLERFRRLVAGAEAALQRCKITNITLVHADGLEGYGEGAPYDRIIVHSAYPSAPRIFLDQMNQQSCLICAIGAGGDAQTLVRLKKVGSRFEREDLSTVHYQPIGSNVAKVL